MNENWKKSVVLFLSSQAISLFGSSLVQYAIMWYITLKTQSGTMMTISIICGFLPTFFLSPFAGVWADRYDRKKLIMLSDSMIALSTLVLAILFLMGFKEIWLLFIISALRALGAGVQIPAVGAFLPQLVPTEKLTKVNATNGSIQSVIMLVSPIISAALLTMASIEIIFFIDVITAAIAVLTLLLFLHIPSNAKVPDGGPISYIADLRMGLSYIKNHSYIKSFFVFCTFFFFLVSPSAFLTPLQVTRSFGSDVWRLTAVEIAFSLGMTGGGILIATWGGFKNRVHTMAMSSFAIGILTFALGVIPVFWLYLFVMFLIGSVLPAFNTPSTVLLQEKVGPEFQGRVFGILGMISSSMMPLGMLVFGPISDAVKIEWLLIVTGILLFIQSFFLIASKPLVEAGNPLPKPN